MDQSYDSLRKKWPTTCTSTYVCHTTPMVTRLQFGHLTTSVHVQASDQDLQPFLLIFSKNNAIKFLIWLMIVVSYQRYSSLNCGHKLKTAFEQSLCGDQADLFAGFAQASNNCHFVGEFELLLPHYIFFLFFYCGNFIFV